MADFATLLSTLDYGAVAVVMGVLTATFGGIIRDVAANEPSILLRRELYVTAALIFHGQLPGFPGRAPPEDA